MKNDFNNKKNFSGPLVPERADFNKSLARIEQFSKGNREAYTISNLDTSSWIFDRKATAYEINQITNSISNHLISLNQNQKEITSEFREIYNAFNALDKKYISGIIGSLNATRDVAFKNKETIEATNKLAKESKDITHKLESNTKVLTATVNKLADFSKELQKIKHIKDVDVLWKVNNDLKQEILNCEKSLSDQHKAINNVKKNLLEDIDKVESRTNTYIENKMKVHEQSLKDITDNVNKLMSSANKKIDSISESFESELFKFDKMMNQKNDSISENFETELLKFDKLMNQNIDNINETINNEIKKSEENISALNINIQNTYTESEKKHKENIIDIENELKSQIDSINEENINIKSKFKQLYFITGTSLVISVISIISILGVYL